MTENKIPISPPIPHYCFGRGSGMLEQGNHLTLLAISLFSLVFIAGCQSTMGNTGNLQNYSFNSIEAEWIRDGYPIEFEGDSWYPADGVEGFLDSEMRLVGEHRGVPVFVDKIDVRPFDRLYTKFDKNKFRFFEKRPTE